MRSTEVGQENVLKNVRKSLADDDGEVIVKVDREVRVRHINDIIKSITSYSITVIAKVGYGIFILLLVLAPQW